jgi:hypothetical protein
MTIAALLLLAGTANLWVAPQDGADAKRLAEAKEEKMICKRIDATESRMSSKKVCMTAKEWREFRADQKFKDGR